MARFLWLLSLLFAGLVLAQQPEDEECEIEARDAPSSSSSVIAPASTGGPAAEGSDGSSAKAADGSSGFYIQAPQPDTAVPDDHAPYNVNGSNFDMTDFHAWRESIKNQAQYQKSKFMKVAPGDYKVTWQQGGPSNIDVTFWKDNWTLDLRGVTLTYPKEGRPDTMFYVNQATPTFTILGGTVWSGVGEIWSQAEVTDMTANPDAGFDMRRVTLSISKGYDVDVWVNAAKWTASNKAPPPGLNCMDVSSEEHYKRVGCNFWYMNFDTMAVDTGARTVTIDVTSRGNVEKGYMFSIPMGPAMATTLVAEEQHGLIVNGLTTDGSFTFIGADREAPPVYKNTYIVNPPLAPGQAPRANGPTFSGGHVDNFDLCLSPPCEEYPGSMWQYTGNVHDLEKGSPEMRLPQN